MSARGLTDSGTHRTLAIENVNGGICSVETHTLYI